MTSELTVSTLCSDSCLGDGAPSGAVSRVWVLSGSVGEWTVGSRAFDCMSSTKNVRTETSDDDKRRNCSFTSSSRVTPLSLCVCSFKGGRIRHYTCRYFVSADPPFKGLSFRSSSQIDGILSKDGGRFRDDSLHGYGVRREYIRIGYYERPWKTPVTKENMCTQQIYDCRRT